MPGQDVCVRQALLHTVSRCAALTQASLRAAALCWFVLQVCWLLAPPTLSAPRPPWRECSQDSTQVRRKRGGCLCVGRQLWLSVVLGSSRGSSWRCSQDFTLVRLATLSLCHAAAAARRTGKGALVWVGLGAALVWALLLGFGPHAVSIVAAAP